jgi:hypothetical protein
MKDKPSVYFRSWANRNISYRGVELHGAKGAVNLPQTQQTSMPRGTPIPLGPTPERGGRMQIGASAPN